MEFPQNPQNKATFAVRCSTNKDMATFKAEVFSVQFIIHYGPVKNERIAYSYPLRSYLGIFFIRTY